MYRLFCSLVLLLSLSGCQLWPFNKDTPPDPAPSMQVVGEIGPWFTLGQPYTLTAHLIGKPYQFFDKKGNDSNLDVWSQSGLIFTRILVLKNFSEEQNIPIKFSGIETGTLRVAVLDSSGKSVVEKSFPYVSYGKDKPYIITEQANTYSITFDPSEVPKAFAAYYNGTELGFFTADEQIFVPKTGQTNILTLIKLDDSDNETQTQLQYQIP